MDKTFFYLCGIILISNQLNAQEIADFKTLDYNFNAKNIDAYISKAGDTLRIGDSLVIGKMSSDQHFQFINQMNQFGGSQLTGYKLKVRKLIVQKTNKKRKPIVWVDFKGWGLAPVYISYEQALEAGEVINPKANMTRQEAIDKLKEAKDLLDLELMTREQYDMLKEKLAPIIMNGNTE